MNFFLDTAICLDALAGRAPTLVKRLQGLTPSAIKIPAIVHAELLLAAEKSRRRERALPVVERFLFPFEIVPFDARAAARHAALRLTLEPRETGLRPHDLIVAATVLVHDATLLTPAVRKFRKVPALRCEEP
ncbi:MAG: type II toxin-antitoxin system VapC family toxin [Acidobacteriota bacterium]|nr:type II toxin-antitoxin system VapC family toxin [Acidobacteriota bacterium]